MKEFAHTVTLLSLHKRMTERDGYFLHPPALNLLPRRVYIGGVLQQPKFKQNGDCYQAVFYGDKDYDSL